MVVIGLAEAYFTECTEPLCLHQLVEQIRSLGILPDAVFLGSSTGTISRNAIFIRDYLQNGVQFASPRLFQDTSTASYLGHICRIFDKPLYAKAFGDGIWPLWEAICYLTSNPGTTVLYCTIEEGMPSSNRSAYGICILTTSMATPVSLSGLQIFPEKQIRTHDDLRECPTTTDALMLDTRPGPMPELLKAAYPGALFLQPFQDTVLAGTIIRLLCRIIQSQPLVPPASVLCIAQDSWGTTAIVPVRISQTDQLP